jgi:hypothetical protein
MSNDFDDTTLPEPQPSISRRSALEYFNPAHAGNWLRRTFGTREKVYEGLKTLGWVVPLTLLIWIYAERQQLLQNPATVPNVEVLVQSNDPSRSVLFTEAGEHYVTLKLMGPQEGVRKVMDQLTQRIPRERLTLALGADGPIRDNQSVGITSLIQNLDLFKSNGVSVLEVQPPAMTINVDTEARRTVPVELPTDHPEFTTSKIDPPNVTVSGPQRVLSAANLKALLKLDGFSQLNTPGTYALQSVPVELSTPSRLHVDPTHVDATVVVSQSDITHEIPAVYVWIVATPSTLRDFNLQLADSDVSITHVVVKGPKEQINAIEKGVFNPIAELRVSQGDANNPHEIAPVFDLPPGVTVVNPEAKKPIKFTATPRG